MHGPSDGEDWLGLTEAELPIAAAYEWAVRPDCGAVVMFSGTTRDHAEGRNDVVHLTYEAYAEQVEPKFGEIVDELRRRWPATGRVVLLHRVGRVDIGSSSVLVVVSSPHRPDAFQAGRFGIDAIKEVAPIWKHEVWADGSDWGTSATPPTEAGAVGSR
ncbi:MAG: molybdenum cofactor biosynthesis protein MoaE [Acidimicrobiia bacterium]|nr:molybdenum cofactor biosynthesis protein MoaE [Acidimicrobiia bacterium]